MIIIYTAIQVSFNTREITVTRKNCHQLCEVITMKYVRAEHSSSGKIQAAVVLINE